METMRQYVVRRASAEKRYRLHADASGIGESRWEWLKKLANGEIGNPGSDSVETLYRYYKLLETKQRRKAA